MPSSFDYKLRNAFSKPLETDRLTVRRPHVNDAAKLAALYESDDAALKQFSGWETDFEYTTDYAEEVLIPHLQNLEEMFNQFFLFIYKKDSQEAIGELPFWEDDQNRLRLSYFITPSERRNHYAFEAYSAVLMCCKDHEIIDSMYAEIEEDNIPSRNFLEKAGFRFTNQTVCNASGLEGKAVLGFSLKLSSFIPTQKILSPISVLVP